LLLLLSVASLLCCRCCLCVLQEEMYSFVTVAGDQSFKGKGTTVVQDS
jgi:hypothetical protein